MGAGFGGGVGIVIVNWGDDGGGWEGRDGR